MCDVKRGARRCRSSASVWQAKTQAGTFVSLFVLDLHSQTSCSVLHFRQTSARGKKYIRFETDRLHFSQKSTMSLNYLALETGQSRAAVSCFNRLLTVTALQISLFPYFYLLPSVSKRFFSKLQCARPASDSV